MQIDLYVSDLTIDTELVTKEFLGKTVAYGYRLFLNRPSEDAGRSSLTLWAKVDDVEASEKVLDALNALKLRVAEAITSYGDTET